MFGALNPLFGISPRTWISYGRKKFHPIPLNSWLVWLWFPDPQTWKIVLRKTLLPFLFRFRNYVYELFLSYRLSVSAQQMGFSRSAQSSFVVSLNKRNECKCCSRWLDRSSSLGQQKKHFSSFQTFHSHPTDSTVAQLLILQTTGDFAGHMFSIWMVIANMDSILFACVYDEAFYTCVTWMPLSEIVTC